MSWPATCGTATTSPWPPCRRCACPARSARRGSVSARRAKGTARPWRRSRRSSLSSRSQTTSTSSSLPSTPRTPVPLASISTAQRTGPSWSTRPRASSASSRCCGARAQAYSGAFWCPPPRWPSEASSSARPISSGLSGQGRLIFRSSTGYSSSSRSSSASIWGSSPPRGRSPRCSPSFLST